MSPADAHRWNVSEAERLVAEAASHGAELVCLPETFSTYGPPRHLPLERLPDGDTARRCAALARRYHLHLIAPLAGLLDGVPRNTALWFDPSGALRGAYNKV